ncbi:sensor histidine kinase [Microvirga sp. P5_D2]
MGTFDGKVEAYELKRFLRIEHGFVRQFALVAAAALLVAMIILGTWVSKKIETGVAEVAGASAALYINTFLSPHLQELAQGDSLSENSVKALNEAMVQPAVRGHVVKVKVWKQDGLIVYSNDRNLVGKRFRPTSEQLAAWSGAVATEVDHLQHEENEGQRSIGLPMLEVYAPIRDIQSGQVIAVLEFYEDAAALKVQLARAQWQSWAVTALVAVAFLGALFSIVSEGSKAIDHMRTSLSHRIMQLKTLLRQNEVMRARVERSARSASDSNEGFMPRVASDLRDRPAQAITFALVHLANYDPKSSAPAELPIVRDALSRALRDLWDISAGLLLPEVKNLPPAQALRLIIQDYERRAQTTVNFTIDIPASFDVPEFIKVCASRFVQVCLDSAGQHSHHGNILVSVRSDGIALKVEVVAEHPAGGDPTAIENTVQLGLTGLWDQIESVGGQIVVEAESSREHRFAAWLPVGSGWHTY